MPTISIQIVSVTLLSTRPESGHYTITVRGHQTGSAPHAAETLGTMTGSLPAIMPGRSWTFLGGFSMGVEYTPGNVLHLTITTVHASVTTEMQWSGRVPRGSSRFAARGRNVVVELQFTREATVSPATPSAGSVSAGGGSGPTSTLFIQPQDVWVEFDPVVPTPARPDAQRPAFAAAAAQRDDEEYNAMSGPFPAPRWRTTGQQLDADIEEIDASLRWNVSPARSRQATVQAIPNPPVILVDPSRPARLVATYMTPAGFDLRRTTHRFTSPPPGRIQISNVQQRSMDVTGVEPGEVRVEFLHQNRYIGAFRALVRRPRTVRYRANILGDSTHFQGGSRVVVDPHEIPAHIHYANVILRQVGVTLVPDEDPNPSMSEYRPTGVAAVFQRLVPDDWTREISDDITYNPFVSHNSRPFVINIAYVRSAAGALGGQAHHWDNNGSGRRVSDSGWPSASWIEPPGTAPRTSASSLSASLLHHDRPDQHIFSLFIAMNGIQLIAGADPEAIAMRAGHTLAHEIGHIFNLMHRGEMGGQDGQSVPRTENLMFPDLFGFSLDILQARAIDSSLLVRGQ
jgi:hypothetical protein